MQTSFVTSPCLFPSLMEKRQSRVIRPDIVTRTVALKDFLIHSQNILASLPFQSVPCASSVLSISNHKTIRIEREDAYNCR